MKQAMIFAAGLGTRLKPLTDRMPKALVEVVGEPLLKRVVFLMKDAGMERIVVNVHHFSGQIKDYLERNDNFGLDIRISDESDMLLDTGGGLRKASSLLSPDCPVLIHNVDILSNTDIAGLYDYSQRLMGYGSDGGQSYAADCSADAGIRPAAVLLVSRRKTNRYLLFDEGMRLVGWTNISTGEVRSPYPDLQPEKCRMYAFSGIHVFSPCLFAKMQTLPCKFPIMDFYLDNCASSVIMGCVKDDLRLMDVGKLDTLAEAEAFVARDI
ncbi:NTP transferase domain-containing protein [Prevotella sp. PCHR]|uniref:NTP transferase domain-containing protein n=1 Tax=Xylanibacter caecicola TaxID=2736294 RepID=A0ABX2AYJ7_9BACT|nr:sugar phosphate nucleotidyltransferase [Xylanibacter caecicola]NPE24314.1 NTP transferase domain-containing protein [Xylanibacter caecicola]